MSVAWKRRRRRRHRTNGDEDEDRERDRDCDWDRVAACSSKHIKCGILNAKLSTTTTTRIGCRIVVVVDAAPSCCRQTLDGDTLRVIELSEMLSPSPLPLPLPLPLFPFKFSNELDASTTFCSLSSSCCSCCTSALQEQIFNSTRKGCQRMQCSSSRVRCLVCRLCRALSMAQATSLWPTYFYNIQFNLVSAGCAAAKARCAGGREYGIECSSAQLNTSRVK